MRGAPAPRGGDASIDSGDISAIRHRCDDVELRACRRRPEIMHMPVRGVHLSSGYDTPGIRRGERDGSRWNASRPHQDHCSAVRRGYRPRLKSPYAVARLQILYSPSQVLQTRRTVTSYGPDSEDWHLQTVGVLSGRSQLAAFTGPMKRH